MGSSLINDFAQAATGTADNDGSARQLRDGLGQLDFIYLWETGADFNRPVQTDGNITGRAFAGFDFGHAISGLAHHFEQVVKFGIRDVYHGLLFYPKAFPVRFSGSAPD
jgi:hypothetical protein